MTQFELIHNMLQRFNVYHEVVPGTGTNVLINVGRKVSFIITFNASGAFVGIAEATE